MLSEAPLEGAHPCTHLEESMLSFFLFLGLVLPVQEAVSVEGVRLESAGPRRPSLDEILAAIRVVESGGERAGGVHATGDGGRAIGPFQIHRAHWVDARVQGRFEDCRDPQYARRVVVAYWKRWCPAALEGCDAEVLARVHNGGPGGQKERGTLAFWGKVKRELERGPGELRPASASSPARASPGNATDARPRPVPVSNPQPREKKRKRGRPRGTAALRGRRVRRRA